eukprot:gene2522-524_t
MALVPACNLCTVDIALVWSHPIKQVLQQEICSPADLPGLQDQLPESMAGDTSSAIQHATIFGRNASHPLTELACMRACADVST